MSQVPWVARLGRQCERYGPGRLPGSDRPAVAAGYALATAAALSTAVWLFSVGGSLFLGGWSSYRYQEWGALLAFGGLVALVFVPATFVAGVLAWRVLPARVRRHGVATDLVAMVGAYLLGTVLVVPITTLAGDWALFSDSLEVALLVGVVGFLASGWLTLPVGAAVGRLHRRARNEATGSIPGTVYLRTARRTLTGALGPPLDRTVSLWARYGPAHLPGGDRPAVGAGYAFAAVATGVSVGLSAVALAVLVLARGDPSVVPTAKLPLYVVVYPIVAFVPVAFGAGALSWQVLPGGLSYRGGVAGVVTMAVGAFVGGGVHVLLVGTMGEPWTVVNFGAYLLLALGWALLPLGAAVGHVHQRARAGAF